MRRLVALAAVVHARLVGRVGFQQQLIQRHRRHQPAQAVRAFVGHRSADAEQEAELVQLRGLLGAAGEAVDHATQAADPADRGDHRIHRAPGVHDHRQVEFPGQVQLGIEVVELGVVVQALDEVIQPAFADRDRPLARDPVAQLVQVRLPVRCEEHRMQAIGRVRACELRADRLQLRPTGGSDGGHHLRRDPGRQCPRMRLGTIRVERRGVEVAVAVDEPHAGGCVSVGWTRLRSAAWRPRVACASSSSPAAGSRGRAAVRRRMARSPESPRRPRTARR